MAKYMVLYVDVKSGDLADVYESDETGKLGRKAEEAFSLRRNKTCNIDGFQSLSAILTFRTQANRVTCRYVHRADCSWVKVCC